MGGKTEILTVQALQERTDSWIKQYGVRYFDEMTNLAILMEEVGEFARLMARTKGEQSFKTDKQPKELKQQVGDEMADIIFVLSCLANQMDIDLTTAIESNFEKKTQRDSKRHIENEKLKN